MITSRVQLFKTSIYSSHEYLDVQCHILRYKFCIKNVEHLWVIWVQVIEVFQKEFFPFLFFLSRSFLHDIVAIVLIVVSYAYNGWQDVLKPCIQYSFCYLFGRSGWDVLYCLDVSSGRLMNFYVEIDKFVVLWILDFPTSILLYSGFLCISKKLNSFFFAMLSVLYGQFYHKSLCRRHDNQLSLHTFGGNYFLFFVRQVHQLDSITSWVNTLLAPRVLFTPNMASVLLDGVY